MNKKLVMWGVFVLVFLVGVVGSYKFINQDNQDMTIELSAPTLPLVSMVLGGESYNTLHGNTGNMDVSDVAEYVCPVGIDRELQARVETFGEKVTDVSYEVRNNDGSRLIEAGQVSWKEKTPGILDFSVKLKDLIVVGEEYIFSIILNTDNHENVCYYTRFVYGNEYDIDNQLDFVLDFHEKSFDKSKVTEIAPFMEPDSTGNNSSLGFINIHSSAKQVVWGDLPVERAGEPDIYITYLQDNFGAFTLKYYVKTTVDETEQYYFVTENFLVSTFGEKLYLLDYERTADSIFQYESDVYQNDKINLSIQSKDIPVTESEDGNMAAFVVNSSLYYYDDIENQMNFVYGFFDGINSDERSVFQAHDIKVLEVSESGSIYFVVYGYMNRGNYEGKTGVALYAYHGQTKLVEENGFYESTRSAAYVMQEIEEMSFFSRLNKFYFCVDGNIVSYDIETGTAQVEIPFEEEQTLFVSEDHSSVVVGREGNIYFWHLDTGAAREITAGNGGSIIPQGFIGNDFVYGVFYEEDGILQSDGSYSRYMREIRIQNAQGEVLKQYTAEGILVTGCEIADNQILLERVQVQDGKVTSAVQEQIVASKGEKKTYNGIQAALTSTFQTIRQVSLKNKIDTASLEFVRAKEVFQEGSRDIDIVIENNKSYCTVCTPWSVAQYVTDAGEAMVQAAALEGYALDADGAVIWKKAATVTKNQIMAIVMEAATQEKSSKNICLDIMLRQIGNPKDTAAELALGKTCQEILSPAQEDYVLMDITGADLSSMLYYTNQDIPIMVLYDTGEAILITGFNQFNIVVMDPVNKKLGYMSRSDASEMLAETQNQVFTYYRRAVN